MTFVGNGYNIINVEDNYVSKRFREDYTQTASRTVHTLVTTRRAERDSRIIPYYSTCPGRPSGRCVERARVKQQRNRQQQSVSSDLLQKAAREPRIGLESAGRYQSCAQTIRLPMDRAPRSTGRECQFHADARRWRRR